MEEFNQKKETEEIKKELKNNRYNEKITEKVYLMKCKNFYKIGISNNCWRRLYNIDSSNPFPTTLVLQKRFNNSREIEGDLHKLFQNKNIKKEWFKLNKKDIKTIIKVFTKGYVSENYFKDWIKSKEIEKSYKILKEFMANIKVGSN